MRLQNVGGVSVTHPMCVNMFLLSGFQALAKPKSHSLMRCGRFESSSVLSSFRSLVGKEAMA